MNSKKRTIFILAVCSIILLFCSKNNSYEELKADKEISLDSEGREISLDSSMEKLIYLRHEESSPEVFEMEIPNPNDNIICSNLLFSK